MSYFPFAKRFQILKKALEIQSLNRFNCFGIKIAKSMLKSLKYNSTIRPKFEELEVLKPFTWKIFWRNRCCLEEGDRLKWNL